MRKFLFSLIITPAFWRKLAKKHNWPERYEYTHNGIRHSEPYHVYMAQIYFGRLLSGNKDAANGFWNEL